MVLWILFAVLAAAVVWAVTRPLFAPTESDNLPDDKEIAVYRDQLAAIETERADGLLGGAEAEGARIELARRLIRRAEDQERQGSASDPGNSLRQRVLYVAAALPVIGIAVYLAVGSPELPSRPYASRIDMPIDQATAADLVARVEAHLREHPDDGRGWDVLAPVYMRMGNLAQSADAFAKSMQLLGESPQRLGGFARANILLQNGIVNEPARVAYEKLLKLKPDSIEPQVWLAVAREQDGDLKGAQAEYQRLLPGSEEPWKGLLNVRLAAVSEQLSGKAPPDAPGAGAAVNVSPADRDKMINQMVSGLAARLKENGNDLKGWMQLVRSYVVLGRREDAAGALANARGQFAGDDKSLAQLNDLAHSLGLGS